MSRWVVHSETEFDAVHALTTYLGAPEVPHTHRWRVAIRVGTDHLHPEGYAIDFHGVHHLLAEVVAPLDGADLNREPEIGVPSPTAERLAEVVASRLSPHCHAIEARLLSVSVWEGPGNRVDLELDSR